MDSQLFSSVAEGPVVARKGMREEQHGVMGLFPGLATTGRPCKLETKHFTINLKIPNGMIYIAMEETIQEE